MRFTLSSPPKPHTFVSLPLQSKIGLSNFKKHLTLPKIFTALIVFLIFFLVRWYIFTSPFFIIDFTFVENYLFKVYLPRDLFLGILAILSRLSLLGFIEEVVENFSLLWDKEKLLAMEPSTVQTLDPSRYKSLNDSNILLSSTGKNPEIGSRGSIESNKNTVNSGIGSSQGVGPSGSTSNENPDPIIVEILGDRVVNETRQAIQSMNLWTNKLKSFRLKFLKLGIVEMPSLNEITAMATLELLQSQSNTYTAYVANRMQWLEGRSINTLGKTQLNISEVKAEVMTIQANYRAKTNELAIKKCSDVEKTRIFFSYLNEYRNSTLKEINKCESIVLEDIRGSALNKHPELKKIINIEYMDAKKNFKAEDSYIKSKISEIINKNK